MIKNEISLKSPFRSDGITFVGQGASRLGFPLASCIGLNLCLKEGDLNCAGIANENNRVRTKKQFSDEDTDQPLFDLRDLRALPRILEYPSYTDTMDAFPLTLFGAPSASPTGWTA